ncbi:hypothetical protein CKSOR_00361 [Candidatus Kinetoplastibacterium sorsogonicusi]|uniref:EamA domain-containing protein n=1 Tax=Candidatus Kinetoplastidibacterium kentomonadis TaxID=1576550 RepID=A0A3S7J9Z1_9PROT|nr:DMT family transporter [Candidatus Kinetoplastibacterium sorsogonicusi]AWD32479.1 hypothetical protein CKSOR_00361 [Candidatus Kinetoplastibacterium sorsogonicusi]
MPVVKQILWMLLSTLMFALMYFFIKVTADKNISLPQIVLFRGFIPFIIIFFWGIYKKKILFPNNWKLHVIRSLCGTLSMWLGFCAISKLTLSTSTCLNYTGPIFIGIGNFLYFKHKKLDYLIYIPILLGFLGILLILQPSINNNEWLYVLFGIGAGFLSAISMLQIQQLHLINEPEWRIVFIFSIFICITSLLYLLISGWICLDFISLCYLTLVGIFGLLGQLFMTKALSIGSLIIPASIQYVTIVFSTIIDFLILKEKIGMLSLLGIIFVIISGLFSAFLNYNKNIKIINKS